MNDKHITSLRLQIIFLIFSIFIFSTGCSEDVEVYEEVANTAIAAVKTPENFCDYVSEHMTEMSGEKYINCANEKISSLESQIINEMDLCEKIYENYVGPPDKGYQLLKCDEEHGVGGKRSAITFLKEFKNIGSGISSCSYISTVFTNLKTDWNATRQFYIDLGLAEQYPEWTMYFDILVTSYQQDLTCEKVTEKFLGIEY